MLKNGFDILYRKLVENVNEAIWMGDEKERTVYANPKFCSLVGYPLEEILGKESYAFWDEESVKRVREVNGSHRRKGKTSSYEANLLTRDGKKIPVLLNGTPLPDGGTIGIMTDLTDLKKERRSTHLLNYAVQNASVAIIIFDEQGKIIVWNQGAQELLGYKGSEATGVAVAKIIPDPRIKPEVDDADEVHRILSEAVHKNGNTVRIGLTFNPIALPDRQGYAFLLIARDVTVQQHLQEEMNTRYEKIREAYEHMGLIKRQMDFMSDLLNADFSNRKATFQFIVASLIIISKADACTLRVYDPRRGMLDLVGSYGINDAWKGKVSTPFKGGLTEKAVLQKHPLRIVNLGGETLYESSHLARENNLTSAMIIPLVLKDTVVGKVTLYIGPDKSLDLFENDFIERYAKLIAIILPNLGKS